MFFKDSLKKNLGLFLIIIGCLFSSGYAFSLVVSFKVKMIFISIVFLGCWMIKLPNINSIHKIKKDGFSYIYIILTLGIILSYFINSSENNILDHIMILFNLYCALFIAIRIDIQMFKKIFVNGMTIFTIISILVWILIKSGIIIPASKYVGLNGLIYKTIWFCTWSEMYPRFMGPFWEPGLFASFLVLAILFEICFNEKNKKLNKIVICSIGILLTASTAGYLLLFMIFFIWIRNYKKNSVFFDLGIILLISSLYLYMDNIIKFLIKINPDVFFKLNGGGLSYDTRLMSPIACFLIFLKNPIFGNGYTVTINMYNDLKQILPIDSLTSTSGYMLAAFGISGIAYTIWLIWVCLKQVKFPIIVRMVIFLILFFIVNKEPHYNNMLMNLILCEMAIYSRELKKRSIIKRREK